MLLNRSNGNVARRRRVAPETEEGAAAAAAMIMVPPPTATGLCVFQFTWARVPQMRYFTSAHGLCVTLLDCKVSVVSWFDFNG